MELIPDVDVPQVDAPQARVEDRAAAHVRAPQEHPTQLAAGEVVLLPFEHVASLGGVQTVDLRRKEARSLLVPFRDARHSRAVGKFGSVAALPGRTGSRRRGSFESFSTYEENERECGDDGPGDDEWDAAVSVPGETGPHSGDE